MGARGPARPGGFVLYFAARSAATGRQCIGAATSKSATGPFTSSAAEPLVCQPELGGSIDPFPFVDCGRDALPALEGRRQRRRPRQHPVRPSAWDRTGLALVGDAVPLLRNDAAWEAPLIENPALVRLDGRYLLLYSGGWWESDSYATGYATCDTPLGPCTKVTTEQPLHASDAASWVRAAATVITGPQATCGSPTTAGPRGGRLHGGRARSLRFASLRWDGARLTVHGP